MVHANSFRSIALHSVLTITLTVVPCFVAQAQDQNAGQDKHLDVQSSAGDLHVGNDADARKTGLPLYPGAQPKHEENNGNANLGLFTDAFGIKLVVAKYDSNDAPGKIVDYYREHLKKFGKVIECHTREHGGAHADFNDDDHDHDHADNQRSKELKCEGDNTGPVTELKVGTEENQHDVSVEPNASGSGSTLVLVYLHLRGKQGDI
jgi:hypothetical protein